MFGEFSSRLGCKLRKTFDSELFRGLSLDTTDDDGDSLAALDSVGRVWEAREIQLEPTTPAGTFALEDEAEAKNYSVHWATGVDKLHEAGLTGKGVRIAIVDTGTAYTHPALGGGFGPGFKVEGGADLVGDSEY